MFTETILKAKLRTNSDGTKLHQTDRNKLRQTLLIELSTFLLNEKMNVKLEKEGIICSFFNEELGEICFVLDLKMKDLSFDFDLGC